MSHSQQRIITTLLNIAKTSEQAQKHASALCSGSKILQTNVNSNRSKYGNNIRCSGHSEIACIYSMYPLLFRGSSPKITNKQRRKLNKLTLYVVRYKSSTTDFGCSAPCYHCTYKIKEFGIKKIIYINHDGNIIKCKTSNYETTFISSGYKGYIRNNIRLQCL